MTALLHAYRRERRADRLHVWARSRSCPFDVIATRVPATGRILDVGCGHGLFSMMLAQAPEREVVGVDVDREKLAVARRAAARAGLTNVRFQQASPESEPGHGWDGICVVDVLYLLGRERGRAVIRELAAALAPRGTLLIKEIDVRPRWKYELARYQELAATRLLRITEGHSVEFLPPAEIAAEMTAAGLTVDQVPLQRRRIHPHHLVLGRAQAGA